MEITTLLVLLGFIAVLLLMNQVVLIRLIVGRGRTLSHALIDGYLFVLAAMNSLQLYFLLRYLDFLGTGRERATYLGSVVIFILASAAFSLFRITAWLIEKLGVHVDDGDGNIGLPQHSASEQGEIPEPAPAELEG